MDSTNGSLHLAFEIRECIDAIVQVFRNPSETTVRAALGASHRLPDLIESFARSEKVSYEEAYDAGVLLGATD